MTEKLDNIDLDALALMGAMAATACPACDGDGVNANNRVFNCPACEGTGTALTAVINAILTAIDLPAIIRKAKAEAYEELGPYVSHRIACALYQSSYGSKFPDCSCGLDAIRQRAGEVTG